MWVIVIGVRNESPEPDATVRLSFSLSRLFDDLDNPGKFDVWAIAFKALPEVPGNLHALIV